MKLKNKMTLLVLSLLFSAASAQTTERKMTLDEVIKVIQNAESKNKNTVRLHTGDPAIYGAIQEQMDELENKKISFEVVPGVSSFLAAAAALKKEYKRGYQCK